MLTISTSRIINQLIGILLSVCFIVVSTALTQNISVHDEHAGHDQQTHDQNWCSWSCQAGQGLHVLPTFVENSPQILTLLELPRPTLPNLDFTKHPTSRGPPLLLT